MRYIVSAGFVLLIIVCLLFFFKRTAREPEIAPNLPGTGQQAHPDSVIYDHPAAQRIETGTTTPSELLEFARTLKGIPYEYACSDPAKGFDCSGFVTYVFDHFHIDVPRSSADFTDIGREVGADEAKPGDIILFTGTDSSIRKVGHIGIVNTIKDSTLDFIHASSGKDYSVTITPLNDYYKGRFMKIIRIFPQNEG